jgi:uncharacterized membrane protein YhhN
MVCLFSWLYTSTGLQENAFWFGLGILLSLVGDVLLVFPSEKLFLFGLIAFLLAHIAYITGFWADLTPMTVWSLLLIVLIALSAGWLLQRIVRTMRAKGQNSLIIPIIVYSIAIGVMLYTALSTIYSPDWKTSAALLVSTGAFLFTASDAILAWNKFVSPLNNGRVWNITLYHLGQIGLIAGVISQFK